MRWSMLPVSICVHVVAGIACLIVPLAADDEWPDPAPLHSLVVAMKAVPVPTTLVPVTTAHRSSAVSVTIPSTIQNEIDTPQPDQPVVSGVPVEGPISFGDFGSNIGTPAVVAPPAPPPVVAAVPPAVVRRVGQGVREPKKIVDVAPVYPDIARRARIQGMVILEAVINEHGGVERLKVLRSVPLLDSAAIDAVSAWRYTPTLLNGLPVSVLMTITINFTLQN